MRRWNLERTGCDGVDKCADCSAVIPVRCEIVDRLVWNAALDPVEQALFRRLVLRQTELIPVPHRHRDRVVQNERPHEAKYQLHLAVHDICTVCNRPNINQQSNIGYLYTPYTLSQTVTHCHTGL